MLVTGGGPEALDTPAAMQVLLGELLPQSSDAKEPVKPPLDTKGPERAPIPPQAATKGAARSQ